MNFCMYLVLTTWNKLISEAFSFYAMDIKYPPQNDHKSNLFPWYKSILWWRRFREFMVVANNNLHNEIFNLLRHPLSFRAVP